MLRFTLRVKTHKQKKTYPWKATFPSLRNHTTDPVAKETVHKSPRWDELANASPGTGRELLHLRAGDAVLGKALCKQELHMQ